MPVGNEPWSRLTLEPEPGTFWVSASWPRHHSLYSASWGKKPQTLSAVSSASHSNTSSSVAEVKCRTPILVRLISAQCHKGKNPNVSDVLWKMPEMLLFLSHGNTGVRVQRVSLWEQNPVYCKFSKPERTCKSNDYEKQPHIHLQDTEMHQTSKNLCDETCSLTLSSHLQSTFGWWQSSFGTLQVLCETFSCIGHSGKRPRISPNSKWNPASTEVIKVFIFGWRDMTLPWHALDTVLTYRGHQCPIG